MAQSQGGMSADDPAVQRFCSITNSTHDEARFFLEANNGHMVRAVQMYYEQVPEAQHVPSSTFPLPPRPAAPGAAPLGAQNGAQQVAWLQPAHTPPRPQPRPAQPRHGGLFGLLLRLPGAVLQTGVGVVAGVLGVGLALASQVGVRVLPASVLALLRGAWHPRGTMRAITEGGEEVNPAEGAAAFVRKFRAAYGEHPAPRWTETGWQQAAQQAHAAFKFLFVYIHSPNHEDADRFCRDTLCNPEVAEYLNATFLCWGGDIRYSDTFRLSSSLRVAAYPYCALLAFSGPRTRLVAAIERCASPAALLAALSSAAAAHGGHFAAEQADAAERAHARALREEQDAAFRASLAADREREAKRQQAQQEKQQEAQAVAAAAAAAKAEREAAAAALEKAAAAAAARRQAARAALGPESAPGPGSAAIRVRLPDGAHHQRRFADADPLQRVWGWVASLEGLAAERFSLATSFPRRVFAGPALQQSLAELGLAPQAVLLVQPLDD